MRRLIKALLILTASLTTGLSMAQFSSAGLGHVGLADSSSAPTILYVNGIRNSSTAAATSSQALRDLLVARGLQQFKFKHSYFWNPTDWPGVVKDVFEVKVQGEISSDAGPGGSSYQKNLGEKYLGLVAAVATDKASFEVTKLRVVQVTNLLKIEIEKILESSQFVVIVPHSQGNLYVEAAYAMLSADPSKAELLNRIQVVGVASAAASTPNDKYITHAKDYVIIELLSWLKNAAKDSLKNFFPLEYNKIACNNNLFVPCSVQGHNFESTYLNADIFDSLSTRSFPSIVNDLITEAISKLSNSQLFRDDFDGTSLDTTKWTVERVGNAGTLTVAGGYLTADVPGGSCGRCGSGDGVRLRPIVSLPTGDFEFIVSGEELLRVANDSSGAKSEVSLGMFAGGVTQLGIGITGDFLNNSRRIGHGVYLYYQIGNVGTVALERSLPLGQYTNFTFRIRRVGSAVDMAFKVADDVTWTVFTVPAAFPAASLLPPVITIGAGDSGGTVINSRFKARLDFASLTGS